MARVLVVEDDERTAAEIMAALDDHGCKVEWAARGHEGLAMANANAYDAIILDRMLPDDFDGLALLASLRSGGVVTPVLILSALSAVDERVRGLRAGGDDYLTKPFEFLELTARVEALLRRDAMPRQQTLLRLASLEIDLLRRKISYGGQLLDLVPREFDLLVYLVRRANQVVTRAMMFQEVWGYHHSAPANLIDVHVSRLRRKLEEVGAAGLLQTVRGSGYIFHAVE